MTEMTSVRKSWSRTLAVCAMAMILLLLVGFVVQPGGVAAASGVTIYVVPTMTNEKIVPTTSVPSRYLSSSMSVVGCPGEYEAASFVLRAIGDVQSLQITATNLAGSAGSIPAAAVDIRVVKCWWQSGTDVKDTTHKVLTPELLLHDDSLVKVENGNNYLKMTTGQYRLVSSTTLATKDYNLVADFPVQDDAASLRPVDIPGGQNKQFWVTVRIPESSAAGTYTGSIKVGTTATIQLKLQVLPIDLLPSNSLTSIAFHSSVAAPWESPSIGPLLKSETQYRAELKNLLAHGVTNPPEIGGFYPDRLATSLRIRRELGITGQPLYCYCGYSGTGNSSDAASLEALKKKVKALVAMAKSYGVTEVYVYGVDEANIAGLLKQKPAWAAVHEAGGKVWTSSWPITGVYDAVGDVLDLVRLGHAPSRVEAAKWHNSGHKILSYSNPQGGLEQPGTYRRNYGLLLWQADYDGGMTFAYEQGFGSVWNDFDDANFRDHMMVYPTSNGVIDTVQWEGFREAVDDLRYMNTFTKAISKAKAAGKDVSAAQNWLSGLKDLDLSALDLGTVRSRMIALAVSLSNGTGSSVTLPVPSLSSPASEVHIKDGTPSLVWSTVTAVLPVHYQLQVDDSASFSSPVVNSSSVAGSSYTVNPAVANGTYYWRVRAVDSAGNMGAWTSAWSLVVDTVAPPAPSLLSPANGTRTSDRTPSLGWSAVSDVSTVRYVLQVDNNADFSSLAVGNSSLTALSYTVPWNLSKGTYYWRVRAVDSAGNWGVWSSARYFVVQ